MSIAKNAEIVTPQDYLDGEMAADIKHEYVDGYIYAMAGASPNHGRIASNISRKFGNHLEGSPCEVFSADMKVKTPTGQYRYPDVLVLCDNQFIDNGLVTQTPTILIEVISRSTRKTDEKAKQLEYINIPTLQEYVIIEQDFVDVRVLRKSEDWRATHYFLGEDVHFESIALTVAVVDIYQRVENQDMTEWLTAQS
jgi:Uma2 family endonuclease